MPNRRKFDHIGNFNAVGASLGAKLDGIAFTSDEQDLLRSLLGSSDEVSGFAGDDTFSALIGRLVDDPTSTPFGHESAAGGI